MATIKDVAMDAGVSVGTVSNVINGGNVSEERKQRVEQSIQKLGYQVNGIARKMRTQRTDYVVVILPDVTNPFYSMLLQGLERALSAYGKQPLLCISDGEKEKEIKYIEMAKANKVDGIRAAMEMQTTREAGTDATNRYLKIGRFKKETR